MQNMYLHLDYSWSQPDIQAKTADMGFLCTRAYWSRFTFLSPFLMTFLCQILALHSWTILLLVLNCCHRVYQRSLARFPMATEQEVPLCTKKEVVEIYGAKQISSYLCSHLFHLRMLESRLLQILHTLKFKP